MNTRTGIKQTVDMVSRDVDGTIMEHIRIHAGGREEVIYQRGKQNGNNN